ncbi:D-alanyl-D-alanine carboxypeptidase family protein [Streptomyces ficellus]|uniref:D-alanyl-D-alanine carboxypeptidase n=1 Tax=Streptomyces ficellus TaxID=1977088 RepID=A0A6I6F8Y2_9ACTN|nr:serine hydrolase [Streptomyces ficellus]QGV79501.1 D-alanyl-D-alanine carboxypeptidase [Streptomyces ficellus]
MIVSSLVAAALLLPSAPAGPAAPRPVEPVPPPAAVRVDPALLHRGGTQVHLPPGVKAPPRLSARSWLVADAATGDVLAAHDAHRRLPPASTLKALFALASLSGLPADRQHTVSEHELRGIGDGSSLVGVREEVTYRVADLWRGVFLSSGNDAVRVLAGLRGGIPATVARMQATARALGAYDTRVVSPDGYDAPGQVSSAYDLAVFGRAGLRDPDFARYAATAYAKFPARGWSFDIRNTNRLLTGADGVKRYPGILGIKNGYTTNAGHTLIAAARKGPRTLVVSVMDPRGGGAYAVYEEARDLLDWGFAAAPHARPVGSLLPPPAAPPVRAAAPPAPAGTAKPPAAAPPAAGPSAVPPTAAVSVATLPDTGDDGPRLFLPLTFVGSACLAAATLWLVRRRTER